MTDALNHGKATSTPQGPGKRPATHPDANAVRTLWQRVDLLTKRVAARANALSERIDAVEAWAAETIGFKRPEPHEPAVDHTPTLVNYLSAPKRLRAREKQLIEWEKGLDAVEKRLETIERKAATIGYRRPEKAYRN